MSLWMRRKKVMDAPLRTIIRSHTTPIWVIYTCQMGIVDQGLCSLREGRKEIAIRTREDQRVDQRRAVTDA